MSLQDKITEANGHAADGDHHIDSERFFESLHRRHRGGAVGAVGGDGSHNPRAMDAREVLNRMSKGDINDKVFEGFLGHLLADKPGREDLDMTEERAAVVTAIKDKVNKLIAEELFVHGADKASELILITALSTVILNYSVVYPDLVAKIVPNLVVGDLLGLAKR